MYNNSFFKKALLIAAVFFLYSCDKEYNEIGGDLVGENNFNINKVGYNITGYTQKTGAIQSNNLEVNPLGIFSNAAFGATTANFNTQLNLTELVKQLGGRPYIESVVLSIPYYIDASRTKTNSDGTHVFVLDSIYGPDTAKMKLGVYESGYFMRDVDPVGGFQQQQKYYTDENALFDQKKIAVLLNDDSSDKSQNEEFFFNPAEHKIKTKDTITGIETIKYNGPGMHLNLNKAYFKTRILDAIGSGKLASNDEFKNYFKGLYFKVEKSGNNSGNLAMLNFKEGKVTIVYNQDAPAIAAGAPVTREKKVIVLKLAGNSVSLLNTDFSTQGSVYNALPNTGDQLAGDEKLYLKGGEGSVAVLDLFNKTDLKGYDSKGNLTVGPNGVSDELDDLRNPINGKKVLVNEASILFHIDANAMSGSYEPQRVYLYDYKNNRPIVDYVLDASSNNGFPKKAKILFDGMIKKEASTKKGASYRIRITDHVRSLINNKDSTNVKLGLVVTEDISQTKSYKLKTPNAFISQAPKTSVMNPLGTILYGSKVGVADENKKIKFEIYFTKPN